MALDPSLQEGILDKNYFLRDGGAMPMKEMSADGRDSNNGPSSTSKLETSSKKRHRRSLSDSTFEHFISNDSNLPY